MQRIVSGLSVSKEPILNYFIDPKSKEYLFPILFNSEIEFHNSIKQSYDNKINEDSKKNIKICIIDSGILVNHPSFHDLILDTIDYTGEGIEDLNGHGSMIAYLWLVRNPLLPDSLLGIKFLIAKVLDRNISGNEDNLINAINWAVSKGADIINISAGINRQLWFYNSCKGNCKLCKTAEAAAEKVFAFFAAAGNNSKTVCPARSGVYNKKSKVISVGASDPKSGNKKEWSGEGTIYSPGEIRFYSIKHGIPNINKLSLFEKMGQELWEQKKYEEAIKYYLLIENGLIDSKMEEEKIILT